MKLSELQEKYKELTEKLAYEEEELNNLQLEIAQTTTDLRTAAEALIEGIRIEHKLGIKISKK